jgi:hypothetical protein
MAVRAIRLAVEERLGGRVFPVLRLGLPSDTLPEAAAAIRADAIRALPAHSLNVAAPTAHAWINGFVSIGVVARAIVIAPSGAQVGGLFIPRG